MIPEKHTEMLEADPVPEDMEPGTVMGPIEEARVFEVYLDDDGDEVVYNNEDGYVEEVVANEEDPLDDPASYGDLLMLVYHAFFQ